eukprot:NODE_69_length_23719_cov_0.556689.p16 type:complete len:115 gc:universal NODE_69_length_23719_cov_0.556689:9096-8752(-)
MVLDAEMALTLSVTRIAIINHFYRILCIIYFMLIVNSSPNTSNLCIISTIVDSLVLIMILVSVQWSHKTFTLWLSNLYEVALISNSTVPLFFLLSAFDQSLLYAELVSLLYLRF